MKVSDAGLQLIKDSEGFSSVAYRDAVGVWTVGYGHTGGVQKGDTLTPDQADETLRQDAATAEQAVSRLVKVPLTQGQFDALVSFTFNLGAGALEGSTLLRLLNAGDYEGASSQFGRWIHAGSAVLPGLVARREKERELFRT